MNFEIVTKTDLKTGVIFFEVLLDGVLKKRFGSRAEALRYIEQLEDEIKAMGFKLAALLESIDVSFESKEQDILSDRDEKEMSLVDANKLKPC